MNGEPIHSSSYFGRFIYVLLGSSTVGVRISALKSYCMLLCMLLCMT